MFTLVGVTDSDRSRIARVARLLASPLGVLITVPSLVVAVGLASCSSAAIAQTIVATPGG